MMFRVSPTFPAILAASVLSFHGSMTIAQPPNESSVVRMVDAAVKARIDNVAGYTVTEHYAVYRSNDEIHPAAEMIVKTTYERNSGKSYIIVSQSGSTVMRNLILNTILDNERHMNQPGIRESAWVTSANYQMKLQPGRTEHFDGRECMILSLMPKRKSPYLFEGILWVDSKDGSIVQLQGTASKNSSMVTGPTQVLRQYASIGGSSEAIHVRAVSNSSVFGETIVKIDYQDYQIQLRPPAG
jgi:hypothetical protein